MSVNSEAMNMSVQSLSRYQGQKLEVCPTPKGCDLHRNEKLPVPQEWRTRYFLSNDDRCSVAYMLEYAVYFF